MTYISDMTWPILTRLGHKYRFTIPFISYDQIEVKGHVGVTGVKKVIFTKNTTPPTVYVAWSRDLCIWSSLGPSTKLTLLEKILGSFRVTGSNWKVKFPKIFKNQLLLYNRCYGHVTQVCEASTHHICQLYFLSWSEVKWGHRGQKVEFTQNATTPLFYKLWSCNSGIWSVYSTCMIGLLLKLIKGQIGSQGSFPVLSLWGFFSGTKHSRNF